MQPQVQPPPEVPAQPTLDAFLERSDAIDGMRLTEFIPGECFEPRIGRGLLGFAASLALWSLSLWLIAIAPHWLLWIPGATLAGLGGWGLLVIAHECGHGSFSGSRRLNYALGHIALLPMLYPFHGWRHVHNLHHANTGHLEKDTDWRPFDRTVYSRMSLKDRLIYRATRSPLLFFLATARYQLISGFVPGLYPSRKARADVRRSIVFVAPFIVLGLPALVYYLGLAGLLKFVLMPWVAMHAWFSATTLMHHTAQDVPFLNATDWTRNASRVLLTVDYEYSPLLRFFTHDVSTHVPHHVAPKIPFYHLRKARAALRASLPADTIQVRRFTWKALFDVLRHCHLYRPQTGFYERFDASSHTVAHGPRAERGSAG